MTTAPSTREAGASSLRRAAMACLIAFGLTLAPASRAADDQGAAAIEAAARKAFEEGRYEEAAEGFAKAHTISPAAITKYNEAFSWQKAGRPAAQADAYEAALIIGTLDADRTAHARTRLAELDKELGVLIIRQPPGAKVYVAHAQGRVAPTRIHLPTGEHEVVVRTAQATHRESVRMVASEERYLAFPDDPPAPGERPGENAGAGTSVTIQEIFGWTSVGLGAGAAVATVALGGAFLAARSDFIDEGQTDPDLRKKAVDLQLATNVMAASAALLGGLGLTLLLTVPSPAPARSGVTRVDLSVDGAGISARVWW